MSTGINIEKKIKVLEENVSITDNTSQINFTGAGVTASAVGTNVTVNVPGSIGSTAFYLNESVTQAPYKEFSSTPTSAAEQLISVTIAGGVTATVASYQTPSGVPNTTIIPAGLWQFFLHFNAGAVSQNWIIRPKVYKRDIGGIETLIFTPDPEIVTNMSTTTTMYTCDGVFPNTALLTTDRIVVKIDLENTTGVSQTATFRTEGSQHYSLATTTLNQVVSAGTVTNVTGTAPIASSGGTTPAISIANAAANGITKGAATFTSSDFNDNGSGLISLDYASGQKASASQDGFLSSTDWTTFNGKQSQLNGTGFVKISGTTISYDNSNYYLASNPNSYIPLTAISSSATGLTYTNTTGVFSLTSGYLIPTTASYNNTNWDTAFSNRIATFTTTGNNGSASFTSNVLNIPTYTLAGLGGQPQLNGTGFVKATGTTITYDNSTYLTSAITSLNGLTASTQTFATPGTTGTAPNWSSATSVHTLNIPSANASGVTAGLISNTEFNTFNNKVSTGAITGSGLTMATSRLLGRTSAGTAGVEEITVGTGLTLSGGTLSASGTGLTVGTTAIASGTAGRILFQGTGNVLQQSANLFWDDSIGRLTANGTNGILATRVDVGEGFLISGGLNVLRYAGTGSIKHRFTNNGTTAFFEIDPANSIVWTPMNMAVGVSTGTAGARLDVRAQGALSTDIAFRVRNSADTYNIIATRGDGILDITNSAGSLCIGGAGTTATAAVIVSYPGGTSTAGLRSVAVGGDNNAGSDGVAIGYNVKVQSAGDGGVGVGQNISGGNGLSFGKAITNTLCTAIGNNLTVGGAGSTNNTVIAIGNGMTETSGNAKMPHTFMFGSYATTGNKAGLSFRSNNINHLLLGYDIMNASYSSINGTNWLGVKTGTAPDGAVDAFQMYSADITAGNAAPHFRTENGAIVKVYQETTGVGSSTLVSGVGTPLTDTDTFDGYTLKQIVKALRNQGLLA